LSRNADGSDLVLQSVIYFLRYPAGLATTDERGEAVRRARSKDPHVRRHGRGHRDAAGLMRLQDPARRRGRLHASCINRNRDGQLLPVGGTDLALLADRHHAPGQCDGNDRSTARWPTEVDGEGERASHGRPCPVRAGREYRLVILDAGHRRAAARQLCSPHRLRLTHRYLHWRPRCCDLRTAILALLSATWRADDIVPRRESSW
jgi:hypothetical protein